MTEKMRANNNKSKRHKERRRKYFLCVIWRSRCAAVTGNLWRRQCHRYRRWHKEIQVDRNKWIHLRILFARGRVLQVWHVLYTNTAIIKNILTENINQTTYMSMINLHFGQFSYHLLRGGVSCNTAKESDILRFFSFFWRNYNIDPIYILRTFYYIFKCTKKYFFKSKK